MSLRLVLTLATEPGRKVAVCGADSHLGDWDTSKAFHLDQEPSSSSTWTVNVPLPSAESEFKFLTIEADGTVNWEPINGNRRFPAAALNNGCKLRMIYGEHRMGVDVSSELIEANARATKKLDDRAGSALQENVDRKGDNAYYFAHRRAFEVPEHAKVISGPGLITGGSPVLIEAGAQIGNENDRTAWLKDYSWSDSTNKVKVYIPVPAGCLPQEAADSIVEVAFGKNQIDLTINSMPKQRLKIEKLSNELDPDACTTRVEPHKDRIVLQLAKKRNITWYNLTKN